MKAHGRACKSFYDGFKQIVSANATCVNERKEPDALDTFAQITSPKFLTTILILYDVFVGVQPLNPAHQKSGKSLALADIPVYLLTSQDKTMSFLEKLKSILSQKTILSQN